MKLNKRRINMELERLGWTYSRLAVEMRVQRQWVSVILNRDGGNTLRTVDRVAEALGLDGKDLLI